MDHTAASEADIEEGPLSDDESALDECKRQEVHTGLPLQYLEADDGKQFVTLQAEETDSVDLDQTGDAEDSNEGRGKNRRPDMRLDIGEGTDYDVASGGIIFSPGGSEAYVIPRAAVGKEGKEGSDSKGAARERPATVGALSDEEGKGMGARARSLPQRPNTGFGSPRGKDGKTRTLQERLLDFRSSLDHEVSSVTSLESSSRIAGAHESSRRILPRPPISREQFLQDPDGFSISLSEVDTTDASDGGGGGGGQHSPVVPSLPLSDRAHSPASVMSAASSTASGMLSGRKHLEWDSGADLGYVEKTQQPEAALSMSTLEKMAIGSYSNLLRTDPEGKSAKSKSSTRTLSATTKAGDSRRRNNDDDLRQRQLHKFADSLMRQRELRQMAAAESTRRGSGGSGVSPRRRQRSRSRESAKQSSGTATAEDNSPPSILRRRQMRRKRRQFGSPLKSNSLNDLPASAAAASAAFKMRPSLSIQDISEHWLLGGIKKYGSSEPSSCSSSATVVPILRAREEEASGNLYPINTDPASLPAQFQGLFPGLSEAAGHSGPEVGIGMARGRAGMSQISLLSKRSGSRSFETVINLEQQRPSEGTAKFQQRRYKSKRYTAKENLNSESVDATDEDSSYFDKEDRRPGKPKTAWSNESSVSQRQQRSSHVSRTSSVATTSDDERNDHDKPVCRGAPLTASSTMESAQIDRAKSFEYFPGESFPMQENSSSYEYLPGHLVNDRPGTVVSNHRNNDISGVASINNSTSSEASNNFSGGRRSSGARRKIDLAHLERSLLSTEMQDVGDNANKRAKALMKEHFKKSRRFYRKVKRCIAFITLPSQSAEESRKKQEVLEYLMEMLESPEDLSLLLSDDSMSTMLSEPTTRHIQTETVDDRKEEVNKDEKTDVSTTTNGDYEEDDEEKDGRRMSYSSDRSTSKKKHGAARTGEIELQKRKIEQFWAVRREMKKLEELEFAYLKERLKCNSGNVIKEADSELTNTDSSTTELKKIAKVPSKAVCNSKKIHNSRQQQQPDHNKDDKKLRKKPSPVPPPIGEPKKPARANKMGGAETYTRKTVTTMGSMTKTKTHLVVAAEAPKADKKVRTGRCERLTSSSSSTASWTEAARVAEFGQTYPTPREDEDKSAKKKTRGVQTCNVGSSGFSTRSREKPVAYYLPLGGQSVIRLGTRVLREEEREDGTMSKENRSILANYIAGVESNARPIRSKNKKEKETELKKKIELARQKYTLQDALCIRRPDFVEEAERRRMHLIEMRRRRLDNEEVRRRWAEHLASLPPVEQARRLRRDESPPPPARVIRLFSHREMVEATRRRYHKLPEVTWKRRDSKRRNSEAANRIIKEVYGRRLQEKVLRGKVSLTHHSNVIDTYC